MNYANFVTRVSKLTTNIPTGVDFVAILPAAIDYAEQRIYRELDLAANTVRNSAYKTMVNQHVLTLPQSLFVTITNINVVSPISSASPDVGSRNPLTPASWDFIDAVYGANTGAGIPQYFALQDAATIAFGPRPDQAYPLELIGTSRPAPLSETNTTTTLSLYFPDLFLSAAMVFFSGYLRNYGAQSDDPQQGVTWEMQTGKLMASAQAEQLRVKLGAP